MTQVMAELPAVVEALTGKKFEDLAARIPGVGPAPTTDGEAEEIR